MATCVVAGGAHDHVSSQPVVGHDERGRALTGTADIFTIDIDTKQQRRLTHAADGEDNYMSSWH